MTVHVKQDFGRGRNFNMEQRAVIKFNAKLGKSTSETFRLTINKFTAVNV